MPTVMSMRWKGVTPEQFNRFVESRLMPGVKQVGIEGEPELELYECPTSGRPRSRARRPNS